MVESRRVKAAKEPCGRNAREARRQSRGRQGRKDLERLPHARATQRSRAPCSSRALGEGEEGAITYATEDFVRRAILGILRRGNYRGQLVCLTCLVTMTLKSSCIEAGGRLRSRGRWTSLRAPGIPMESSASFLCGHCRKTIPCLGATYL